MNNFRRFDLPLCSPIQNIVNEDKNTSTLEFLMPKESQVQTKPGQYFMLWNPGDDEIPISISKFEDSSLCFTIRSDGKTSNNLVHSKIGNYIGLRGPFGNGFDISDKGIAVIIGGGIGIAPLRYLIHSLVKLESLKIILIYGSRTESSLYFKDEFERLKIRNYFCTDDGSFGFHGFPTEILPEILSNIKDNGYPLEFYTCGPETMMKTVLEILDKHGFSEYAQFSLANRYIRCGFGICGSCFIDDIGLSLCQDGPIFRGNVLLSTKDFGLYGKNSDGSKFLI